MAGHDDRIAGHDRRALGSADVTTARAERSGVAGALGWVAGGSMVANVCAYLIHLTASRWWLDTAEYGELAVGLTAMLVLTVAALALQAVVARAVVHHADPRRIRRVTVQTTIAVCVLVVVAIVPTAWVTSMSIDTTSAALVAAPMLTVIGAGQGILQGHKQFRLLGWVLAAVGVLRTAPLIAALAVGAGPAGALAASASGIAVAAVVVLYATRVAPIGSPTPGRTALGSGGIGLLGVVQASGVQLVLVVAASVDLLLSRTVLSPDDAGIYALGAIATKVAFWLPQAVGVVFYPRLADPATSRRSLVHAVGVVALIGVILTVGAGLAGPLVPVLVRPDYQPLVPILWLFAYTGAMLAVLQVALLSAIARSATGVSAVTWVVVAAEIAVIVGAVDTIVALAATAATAATIAAVTTTVWGLRAQRVDEVVGAASRE